MGRTGPARSRSRSRVPQRSSEGSQPCSPPRCPARKGRAQRAHRAAGTHPGRPCRFWIGSGSAPSHFVRVPAVLGTFPLQLVRAAAAALTSVRGARERVQTERPTLTRASRVKVTDNRRHLAGTTRKCISPQEEPVL